MPAPAPTFAAGRTRISRLPSPEKRPQPNNPTSSNISAISNATSLHEKSDYKRTYDYDVDQLAEATSKISINGTGQDDGKSVGHTRRPSLRSGGSASRLPQFGSKAGAIPTRSYSTRAVSPKKTVPTDVPGAAPQYMQVHPGIESRTVDTGTSNGTHPQSDNTKTARVNSRPPSAEPEAVKTAASTRSRRSTVDAHRAPPSSYTSNVTKQTESSARRRSNSTDPQTTKPAIGVRRSTSANRSTAVNAASSEKPPRRSTSTTRSSVSGVTAPAVTTAPKPTSTSASKPQVQTAASTRPHRTVQPPSSYRGPLSSTSNSVSHTSTPSITSTSNKLSRTPSTKRTIASKPPTPTSSSFHTKPDATPNLTRKPSTRSQTQSQSRQSSPTKPSHGASPSVHSIPQSQSLTSIRHQVHLLHLILLHAESTSNTTSYLTSATTSLSNRRQTLRSTYQLNLGIGKETRRARNLVALQRWCGGNRAALSRRFGVLVEVLEDVRALVAGAKHTRHEEETNPDFDEDETTDEELGDFTLLTQQFDVWRTWVGMVWGERDAYNAALESEQQRFSGGPVDGADALPHEPKESIEGLGDAFKSCLRGVQNVLNRLDGKLASLREPAIPIRIAVDGSETDGAEVLKNDRGNGSKGEAGEEAKRKDETPTPRFVVDTLTELVIGMRDECQIMREVEWEVVEGERLWVEQSVKGLGI